MTERKDTRDVEERRSVKVTDKRRVRADGEANPDLEVTENKETAPPEAEHDSKKAAEYLEDLQRLKAEFDNYRKRVLKEQTRALEFASEPLIAKMLEVLDEFELALIAAERQPEFERFLQGVEMVYAKLQEILRAEGLERIEAEGKPFDPELHEALLQGDDHGEGEPVVTDVLRTGYTLKGRVIRPSGVKVGRR